MPATQSTQRMILMGRVLAPYGVKGWVKVEPFTESPESLQSYQEWHVGYQDREDAWQTVTVAESAEHSGNVVAHFEACHDRDAALAFRGMVIAVPRSMLPAANPGEFYQSDLLGLKVVNDCGEEMGHVAEVFSNGAHEVLRVDGAGGERLLPFVDAFVREVDMDAGVVRMDWKSDW